MEQLLVEMAGKLGVYAPVLGWGLIGSARLCVWIMWSPGETGKRLGTLALVSRWVLIGGDWQPLTVLSREPCDCRVLGIP